MPLWHTCRPTPCRRPATNAPSYTASRKSGYRKEPEHFGPPFPRSPFHCPCMEISKTVPDAPGDAPPGLPGGRGTAFVVPNLDSPVVPAGRESPLVPMGRWRGIGAPPTACWLMGPGPPSRTEFRTTQSPKTVAAAEVLSGDADTALLRFERGVIGIKTCLPPPSSSSSPAGQSSRIGLWPAAVLSSSGLASGQLLPSRAGSRESSRIGLWPAAVLSSCLSNLPGVLFLG